MSERSSANYKEKDFIRKNLQKGRSVDEVITLVEKEYGHRIA